MQEDPRQAQEARGAGLKDPRAAKILVLWLAPGRPWFYEYFYGDWFLGSRKSATPLFTSGVRAGFFADDLITKINTLVADKNRGSGNQFANFVLALATE